MLLKTMTVPRMVTTAMISFFPQGTLNQTMTVPKKLPTKKVQAVVQLQVPALPQGVLPNPPKV